MKAPAESHASVKQALSQNRPTLVVSWSYSKDRLDLVP